MIEEASELADPNNAAAAYLKLQEDVRQLIVDTIYKELMNYGSPLHSHIKTVVLHTPEFEHKVRQFMLNQMQKY